ncbi:MAG: hypothetical protein JNL63_13420 [Bacteroidia bacterium]|nr:hypothetical protein [Bacteroidia bacterium]
MKIFYNFIVTLLIAGNISANINDGDIPNPNLKAQAKNWMQSQPVQFIENKGQMTDMEGKPVPFVLFKAEAPGLDMYVTEKGLTYIFIKAEEDENEKEDSPSKGTVISEHIDKEKNRKIEWNRIDMALKGASILKANIIPETTSVTDFNFFYGHCTDGIYGVKKYEKITIKNIYPGIDWILYNSNEKGFKYDFIIHPGADPKQIELIYSSLNPLSFNRKGEIEIKTGIGALTENAPVSYQNEQNIKTQFIESCNPKNNQGGYDTHIQFALGKYNNEQPLVIDPQLVWATFYGGSGPEGFCNMDCDINGNIYVTGYVISADFPTQAWGGAYYSGFSGTAWDVFILRFSNIGALTWATYYGGTNNGNNEVGLSIKTDAGGNVFVAGYTTSPNFPTQAGTGSFTGAYYDNTLPASPYSGTDGFILRFSNTGVRTWATLVDYAGFNDMTLDVNGNIYLAGSAGAGCPLKPWGGAYFDASMGGSDDCYILRFSNKGMLTWATYYGGSILTNNSSGAPEFASKITTDAVGNIYVSGQANTIDFPTQAGTGTFAGAYYDNTQAGATDIFILRFSNKGVRTWATLYGGSIGVWGRDHVSGLRVDVVGNIYVTGVTDASDFPTQPWGTAYFSGYKGGSDAFILRFSNTGLRQWATYYGGTQKEDGGIGPSSTDNLEIDNCGNIFISFDTYSSNIPTLNPGCASYFDGSYGGGSFLLDQFLVEFNNTGTLLWATYIGGNNNDFRSPLAIDKNNNVFLGGEWTKYPSGVGLPFMNLGGGAYFDNTPNGDDDSFIMKFIPVSPTYTKAQVNQSGCSCNGTATVTVNCGKPPFNYVWNNGSQTLSTTTTTNTITGLCAGDYNVIVTDAACIQIPDTVYFTITGSGGLTLTPYQTNAGCVNPGTASVAASGGIAPYTYNWSPTGQTSQTATGLSVGNYTVTVKDNTGCISNKLFTIVKDTGNVSFSISYVNPSCNGGIKGSATANIISGTSPYIYNWSNGQTTQTATGLNAGIYTITVTDNTACTSTRTVEILNSTGNVSVNITQQNVICAGANTGNAIATPAGGNGTYTFIWSNGQTGATATGLSAGNYFITVTDANGCSNAEQVILTESPAMNLTTGGTPSTCGGATGRAQRFISPPGTYTQIWSNGQTTWQATGLSAGVYTVTVTNADGCTATAAAIVDNSNGPSLSVSGTCSSYKVTAAGGTLPYTYSWNSGQTTQTVTGLAAGVIYTVTVTDASGCSNLAKGGLPPITVTVSSVPASCGNNNGSTTVGASGINSYPYTYLWNNAQTTQIATNLAAGTYAVTVTGSNGCTQTGTVTVTSDNCTACSLSAKTNINTNVSCNGGANGSATVSINNGSGGPYVYSWSNGNNGTTTGTSVIVTGLQAATYTVTISEGACTSTSTVSITSPLPLVGQFTKGTGNCNGCGCKEWVMITAMGGTNPYSYTWSDGYLNRYKNQLCPGVYSINIKDKNGCSINVNLTAP